MTEEAQWIVKALKNRVHGGCPLNIISTASRLLGLEESFPFLANPGLLALQVPETLASTVGGEGFWTLQSKNTWVTQAWEHLIYKVAW